MCIRDRSSTYQQSVTVGDRPDLGTVDFGASPIARSGRDISATATIQSRSGSSGSSPRLAQTGEISVDTATGTIAYQQRAQTVVESTSVIYDSATAVTIARRRVREGIGLSYSVPYRSDPSYGWISVGQVIALTDSALALSGQFVEVVEKSWSGVDWEFVIYYTDDPAR